MKACRILFSVGVVAVLATPTWAQNGDAGPPAGEFFVESTHSANASSVEQAADERVENAVATDNGSSSSMIQPAGFVLLGDRGPDWCGGGECGSHGSDCRACQVCEPRYSGCSTYGGCQVVDGCQTFGDCPEFYGDGMMVDGSCIDSCCGNRWEFRAGWINLKRVTEDVSLVRDFGGSFDVFNGDDFDYDFRGGVDAAIIAGIDGCSAVEFRYLYLDDIGDSRRRNDLNPGALIITRPPQAVPAIGQFGLVATNESRFQTAEMNIRSRAGSRVTLIGGFRYAELDERFTLTSTPLAFALAPTWDVENDMYGIQGGIEVAMVRVAGDKFRIDGLVKAGVYYNDIRLDVVNAGAEAGNTDDSISFLGEFGLSARYQVHRNVAVQAGYQVVWFNSVATAEHQVGQTTNIIGSPLLATVDDGNNALFHGINLMIIGTF